MYKSVKNLINHLGEWLVIKVVQDHHIIQLIAVINQNTILRKKKKRFQTKLVIQ